MVPHRDYHYYYPSTRISYYHGLTQPMPRRIYWSVGIARPIILRPHFTVWTPAVYPVYVRPVYTTQVVTSVRSREWYALQDEINALYTDVSNARAELGNFPSVTGRPLDDAGNALNDAQELLNYGYSFSQVRTSIDQARSYLDYAYSEHTAAENALLAYRDHARAQIREAEYYAASVTISIPAHGALRQARNAYARGESAIASSGDQALRYFEEAATLADRVADEIAQTAQQVDNNPSAERYASLLDWHEQLVEYIQTYPDHGMAALLERSAQELELAQSALTRERNAVVDAALDRAEAILNDVTATLERFVGDPNG